MRIVSEFLAQHHTELYNYFTQRHIQWQFNPPQAPHFGGLWEAAVKSAKTLFKRHFTSSAYTFEEYCTLFSRIEAILNSRPLCLSPLDPGRDYLTPGHLLIGAPLIALPEEHVLSASPYCSR